ncbi:MAG: AcrR family transcriptional regulator [Cognaticolwellia sp.]
MSTPPTQSPRRTPRQQRSHDTVDVILQATAQVLAEWGYAKSSTNRIAKRAGVSVGSLYQYFPNKDALFHALIERHVSAQNASFSQLFSLSMGSTPQVLIQQAVRALVASHRVQPELHMLLISQLGGLEQAAELLTLDTRAIQALEAYFRVQAPALRPMENPRLVAEVIVFAVEAVVHRSLMQHPDKLEDPAVERELILLVAGYLLPGTGSASLQGNPPETP